ncbi:MAG: endolytic transglycosylase MltG [Clostridiales bacterium]|nr:endolytic transglycosylase MltG [Clostridiales bacterium]
MNGQKAMLSAGLFILRLAILILVIVGIYKVGETAYMYCYSIVSDSAVDAEPGRDVSVTLTRDMKAKEVAVLLERKGLVADADIFRLQMKVNQYEDILKEGNYILNTSMTPREMMQVMAGKTEEEEE